MAKPIAGINDYPFGICGYIVDGAILKNGVKLKALRIYKQRSINTFDLIDPNNNTVYQKVQIAGYDTNNKVLDYSLTDDELLSVIPVDSFFMRGYNPQKTITGFVIRFLYNKVVLSNGIYLYDMYKPECGIPSGKLNIVLFNKVTIDSTFVTGSISTSSGTLNEEGMVATLTTPDGVTYTGTVNNRIVIFDGLKFDSIGTGTITITSPHYDTLEYPFEVLEDAEDDYVTIFPVSEASFTLINENGLSYSAVVNAARHGRGKNLVIQVQTPNGIVFNNVVDVDADGNITITQYNKEDIDLIIIGDTKEDPVFSTALNWTTSNSVYTMTIPSSTHQKHNVSVSVYDGTTLVSTEVQIDNNDNVTLISNEEFTGKVVIAGKD